MCGIAGIFGIQMGPLQAEETCRGMLAALKHRGPDAEGFFHDHGSGTHLIHARLSIIDPGERSNQPMLRANRYSLVFNGEIYNYAELKKELEEQGSVFRTTSDTEVILAIYERSGIHGFSRLRGMFAFALFDQHQKSLTLARDAFGIKPLYYSESGRGLVFASEVRCLLASNLVSKELSPEGAAAFFRWGSCQQDNLPLKEVRALAPGTASTFFEDGSARTEISIAAPSSSAATTVSVEGFRETFLDSVRHHLVSDVPVGLFLSGGLDSCALLQAASLCSNRPLHTFTLSFPGAPHDEGADARKQAQRCGSIHTEENMPEGRDLAALFETFLQQQDLPTIDGFNTFCVSRLARKNGIKVVLSGLGGDELLGGYPSFHLVPRLLKAAALIRKIPFASRLCSLASQKWLHGRSGRLAEFFGSPGTPEDAYASVRSLFSRTDVFKLSGYPSLSVLEPFAAEKSADKKIAPLVSAMELNRYLRNQLLRDTDVFSMFHGIEARVPFLDVPLWQKAAHLPESVRYQPGKKILQDLLPELDPGLFQQDKKGFSLPYDKWRHEDLLPYFKDVEKQTGGLAKTWYQQVAWIAWNRWKKEVGIT